eukprot:jgi/Astpho2/9325/Aster-07265
MAVLAAINLRLGLSPGSLVASDAPTSSVINSLIGAFGALLETRSAASGSPPVTCIDEVTVLMDWYEGDRALQTDLQALLRFFVQITKETQRAHVTLATSEYRFLTWLTESQPPSCLVGGHALAAAHLPVSCSAAGRFFTTGVIGNFPEPEARTYSQGLMMRDS